MAADQECFSTNSQQGTATLPYRWIINAHPLSLDTPVSAPSAWLTLTFISDYLPDIAGPGDLVCGYALRSSGARQFLLRKDEYWFALPW